MEVFFQWSIMLLGILGVVQLGEFLSIWLHARRAARSAFR